MKKRVMTLLLIVCLVACMGLPVYAADNTYIFETTGVLLDGEEIFELEQQCAAAAANYGCGIYVVTLDDFSGYHPDPLYAAEEIYRSMGFGVGENRNGILLMLSMSERDYAMVAYGDIANSVFTDRVQDRIIDDFLDDFSVNDWEEGLSDYVENAAYALATFDGTIGEAYSGYYEDGEYHGGITITTAQYIMGIFGVVILPASLGIALVVCLIMKGQMKTNRIAYSAEAYIPKGGVSLKVRTDKFTHVTTHQIVHSSDDDDHGGSFGGGTTVRSSGFSGRSGKF